MLRAYNTTPGTATNDTAPRQSQVLSLRATRATQRPSTEVTSPSSTDKDLLAQQRATFSPAKTIATTRAPNRPSTRTPCKQGPAHAPGTCGASMLAGQPRVRIGGGWKHHQSSTRDKSATPSPCRPNLTSGRSWIWGRHRSHGLPAQYMVRCGGRAGTCDCWKEH
jgi:hypothetical protein